MRRTFTWISLASLAILLGWGCGDDNANTSSARGTSSSSSTSGSGGNAGAGGGGGGGGGGAGTLGVGEPCDLDTECRDGLVCEAGLCAPGHATEEGFPCTLSAECLPGLFCANGLCAPAGEGVDYDSCSSDADCASGYRCVLHGLGAVCLPEGTVDVGGDCSGSGECFGGLGCVEGTCQVVPPGVSPFGVPWDGVDCADESGAVEAFFRVPRGTPEDGDFFRLPMPNDVRLDNGTIDLTGHPTPGPDLLGYDIVDRYLRAVEQDSDGWGMYHVTSFRFSAEADFATLQNHIRVVDLTTGFTRGYYYQFIAPRSRYDCGNRLLIGPLQGSVYRSGHTYAVYVTTDVKDENGGDFSRPSDLVALLDTNAPVDADLAAQWPKYATLRNYLANNTIDPTTILNATVFTVGNPRDVVERLHQQVVAAPAPTASSWTLCDDGVLSPCPDASGPRACAPADPDFDELHALVSLPIYQEGVAPYETMSDGGNIGVDGGNDPVVDHNEQICLSLTVPKGTPPAGGWPTLVFAHGTGGHFRSHVSSGIARAFAQGVDDGQGTVVAAAVLGIDQVAHGPRRNGSLLPPQQLFFNFSNPLSAKGYPQQGAADQMALLRFVPTVSFSAASSPTGVAFSLAGPPAFWGHSQGATHGSIALPYDDWAGALLSGQGASLRDVLVSKHSPVDIAAVVPLVLGDPAGNGTLFGTHNHPVLSWIQTYFDGADPVAYGRLAIVEPPAGSSAHHLFQPFGTDDTYTPDWPQATYAAASGLTLADHDPSVSTPVEIGYPPLVPQPTPVSGNLTVASKTVTAAVRQYGPAAGDDGHFVVFDVPSARADAERFLAGVLAGTMPRVGP